jgi:hypothetical protein
VIVSSTLATGVSPCEDRKVDRGTDWGALSSGAYAILGAVVGGYFTSRAATSTERLKARAAAVDALRVVEEHWNAVPFDDPDLEEVRKADTYHRRQQATMFLAGVPFDVFDRMRTGQRAVIAFRAETAVSEESDFTIPEETADFSSFYQSLVSSFLLTPRRAWFRNHSLRAWQVRRAFEKSEQWGYIPVVGYSFEGDS